MPKPDCIFVTPPATLSFDNGVEKTVQVNINPLSDKPFHMTFVLTHNPATFDNGGKIKEFFPVEPKDPFGNENYDFNIIIKNSVDGPVFTQLTTFAVSSSGKSQADEIAITIH